MLITNKEMLGRRVPQTERTWVDKAYLVACGIPDSYIRKFVAKFGNTDTRKLGSSKQAKRLYCYEAVNRAIAENLIDMDEEA